MVEVARERANAPYEAKTEREYLIEREYKQKAWSELMRWKHQVPHLVPETMEELQEGLRKT
jgi:hypothetical protein